MARVIKVDEEDSANGPGVRVVVWLSGCEHRCPGCQNPATHSFETGSEIDEAFLESLHSMVNTKFISGLTISGGDPFHPSNLPDTMKIIEYIGSRNIGKTIWVWTGYKFNQLPQSVQDEVYIDVIVDGKFVQSQKDSKLKYRGSRNQVIWNQKSPGHWVDITSKIDPAK